MKPHDEFLEELFLDTNREQLAKIWDIFRSFSSDKRKEILEDLLGKKEFWYHNFLATANKDVSEIEKEKAISYLNARLSFGLPYSREKILNILDSATSLEDLREHTFNRLRQDFDYNTDRRRCFQVARQTRQERKRLVCGRFSRAFYIDALLLANSAFIATHSLRKECDSFQEIILSRPLLEPLQPAFERLAFLLQEKEVSRSALIHAFYHFRSAVDACEWSVLKKHYENSGKKYGAIKKNLEKVRILINRCLKKTLHLEGWCPVTMVFFQRISPAGSLNIATLNEMRDPFFGEDEEIEKLLAFGGENLYITPNMDDWLTQCDDWVEALPAYAGYEIVPQNGNYRIKTRVERDALEVMMRSHAGNWKKNIENVLTTEFLHGARILLARTMKKHWKNNHDLCRKFGENRMTAILAVLLEDLYYREIVSITRNREKKEISRLDALLACCQDQNSNNDLIQSFFREVPWQQENFDKGKQWLSKKGLDQRLDHFLSCLTEPLRDMPSLHILTTLGPGETEYNVKNWLEESMLLTNIIEAYKLEDAVRKKQEDWKAAVIAAARRIIAEEHLEAEVIKYGEDDNSLLNFLQDHQNIGGKVARFCLLRLAEKVPMHKDIIAEKEPRHVTEILQQKQWESVKDEHERYMILDESRQEAYTHIQGDMDEKMFFRQYLHPVHRLLHAQRTVVSEHNLMEEMINPLFRYEAEGPLKCYHLLYTPSRVDLGANEVSSVRDIPKWVGALDEEAANRAKQLYELYNIGGPVIIPSTKVAEFLKVGENFFSRGGVYYLSLAAGVNIDTLGFGDFEFFRNEWNKRGDRLVLPGGETYGGFCVPKEFTLLYASILSVKDKKARESFLSSLGISPSFSEQLLEELQTILSWKNRYNSLLEWEKEAYNHLLSRYKKMTQESAPSYLFPLTKLALTLEKMGILNSPETYNLADWVNKKAQGLEEINRIGPYRKVQLIYELLQEARSMRKDIAPPEASIGVMAAPYKEGEVKDGRSIPISDVRFSAGCRKLEIYAGVHEEHILYDIDFQGRKIIQQLMENIVPPADIRMVGSCTGSDILNYVPGSGLDDIKNAVLETLLEWDIDEDMMETNSILYGGDLRKWIGIKEKPAKEQKRLFQTIAGRIHLLVVEKRGTFATYEEALQGADFIDLGIPDPELLDLTDDLPRMLSLMRRERIHSALIFADGTSGARRPAFAFRYPDASFKVKELFALEPHARYGCLGIGKEQIASWRKLMEEEKSFAENWGNMLAEGKKSPVKDTLQQYHAWTAKHRCVEISREQEEKAHQLNIWTPYFRYNSRFFFMVAGKDFHAGQLDFGAWLLMGGKYLLNGRFSSEGFTEQRNAYEKNRRALFGKECGSLFSEDEIDEIIQLFLRPYYSGKKKYATEIETGLAGSLKAVEEQVSQLARWEERKKEFALLRQKNECKKICRKVYNSLPSGDVKHTLQQAQKLLPSPDDDTNVEQRGQFFAAFIHLLHALNQWDILELDAEIDTFADTLELPEEEYVHLAQKIAASADNPAVTKEHVTILPAILEMLDITFLIYSTSNVSTPTEMNSRLAKFFDRTINNHIFDYFPYHYHRQRSAFFEQLSRKEKLNLAYLHHQWLYTHLHWLIHHRTPLKNYDEQYRLLYTGDALHGKRAAGIIELNREENFWFHYARLRDIVVLYYEQYGYPRVVTDVDHEVFGNNIKLAIIYPYGNTTVPVALEQAPALDSNFNIDLFMCAFPRIITENGTKKLVMDEAMICPAKSLEQKLSQKYPVHGKKDGPFMFVRLKNPLCLQGIFFHFTHPLRMEIDSLNIPVIQPLPWEAASHLKCQLPAMLKNTGVAIPEQLNWFSSQTSSCQPDEAWQNIRKEISSLARHHDTLILKPEKESGGRKILLRKIREDAKILDTALDEMTEAAYQVSRTDNVVIQEVLESSVRRLYDNEFLEEMVERFARINIPVFLHREPLTPLYSYFRIVVAEGEKGLEYSHHMTVISTQGVANVGQGGLLFEYCDDIIHPRYRKELNRQLHQAALESWKGQKKYLKDNWLYAVEEYLKLYPEFRKDIEQYKKYAQSENFITDNIPYEMGDYMPVFLINEEDRLVALYDSKNQKRISLLTATGQPRKVDIYDAEGKTISWDNNNLPRYYTAKGHKKGLFDAQGNEIPPFVVYKIEANPGAGLWRPHNDQLPPERKGEGVITIFRCLGQLSRRSMKNSSGRDR